MSKFLKRLPALLKKFVTYNIGYKIMALIFAIILWLVVVNIQNPASTRTFMNIPVEIINEESVLDGDHIYSIKSGKTATITVAGTRSVLGNLSTSDFEAVADFSALSITNAAPITVTLSSEKARYENQIDITLNTTSMVIDVENLVTHEYPVEIRYIGTKPEDMVIDKIERSPERIAVSAPETIAATISGIGVMANYNDIVSNEPIELVPILYDEHGNEIGQDKKITLSSETVAVQFITYETKKVPVTIEAFGTPADGYELTDVTLSRTEVQVKGTEEALAKVTSIVLPDTLLNVSNRTNNVSARIDLTEYLPEGVSLADGSGSSNYVFAIANIEKTEEEETTALQTTAQTEAATQQTTAQTETADQAQETLAVEEETE